MSSTVFDLEGNGLYDEVDTLWCMCTQDLDTGETTSWDISEKDKDYNSHYDNTLAKSDEWIGHNILNYDVPVLKKLKGIDKPSNVKLTDTLVMSRLANPDRQRPEGYTGKGGPHSLESWGYRVGRHKVEYEDWSKFTPEMLRRCSEDVGINALIVPLIKEELEGFSEDSIDLEHKIAQIITEQERRGVSFDKKAAEEYIEWLTSKIADIDNELVPKLPKEIKIANTVHNPFLKTGGYRKTVSDYLKNNDLPSDLISGPFTKIEVLDFNLGSTTKVKDYLLASGWIPESYNFSKKTGERTSPKLEGDFEGIDGELPRLVKERITWRHRKSNIEGWVKALRDDNSLSAGANPCGTNTNRMRHHTVVNIPKANTYSKGENKGKLIWNPAEQRDIFGTQMRSLFIPRVGFKLVGHDASGLEIRMLAHYLNDPTFIDEVLRGDIHSYNQQLAGLDTRDQAKTFIYALIYGAGDAKMGSIVGGTSKDGEDIKERYFSNLPSLKKFIGAVKRSSSKGWLKGLDGRRIHMRKDSRGRIARSKAPNTLLQSAGSIVMKRSCVLLWDEVKRSQIEAYKVLDMHDEGQSEVKNSPSHIEPYCEAAVNSIIQAGKYYNMNIPLDAEAKVGDNLAETH